MCKVTQTRIGEKNIMFNLSISNDIPYELIGDKGKVKIIINNLLTNAIKYTDAGKIDLNIKCINDLNKNVSNIIVTCQDTGKAIKTEFINRLFTKFDRLDVEKNTTIEGTGLGLAITKSLLEMMGGKINVQSQFGKGSIFMVQIPQKINKLVKPMSEKEMEKNCVKVDEIKDANLYRNKKVLVVDDNKLNIKVVMRALKDFNFIFDECYDGRECIEKVNSGNVYDLILMDIMMPNMNGEQAIAELKKISTFNTPVIALTADAITGAKEKYINEGFFDYIAKPFSRDQIKEIIDKIFSSNNFIEKNSQDQQVNENTYLNKNSKYSTGENNVEIDLSKDKNFNIIYDEQYLLNNGVNYKKGLELFGDIDTYKSMLLDWFNESNNKFEKIKFTKLNHDMQNYAVAVHALKSDSKYFGFEKLALIAYEHEMKSKSGDEEYINTNFKFLENEFNKVIIIVGKYLNNK